MSKVKWVEGGLYLVDNGNGTFEVVKILKLEDKVVHTCQYTTWEKRPTPEQVTALKADDIVIGHTPLSRFEFAELAPAYIATKDVTPEELEGYEIWKADAR